MAMRRVSLVVLLAATVLGALAAPARAELDPEQVREAIRRGIQYLQREQNADGSWPRFTKHDLTGLCTLALLHAGVKPDDPQIIKALAHLRKPDQKPTETYETALQTMVFCLAEPNKDSLLIRRNAVWLEQHQIGSGPRKGAWSYPGGAGDNSNTQFALLALHEAERVGVKVRDETWRMALGYWQSTQNVDGSWGYQEGMPGSASMTCAGITSVIIAGGRLHGGEASITAGQVQCCGQQTANQHLERAMAWLGNNFSVHTNIGGNGLWLLYYLYGVERVGRLTAQRFIGGHDWYREGTEMLVRSQDQLTGFWKGTGHVEDNPHIGSSLALLFLAKGRRPVLMSRLKYGEADSGDWNHHPHSLTNLTSYVETRWQREMTWQVIEAKAATIDDLVQSPVLFISGREQLVMSDEQVEALREYINRGGFIFAEACCDGVGFHQDFQSLMERVFPEPEFKLRELGPEHPVWQAEERVPPEHLRPLWGVEYGCRTSVIYVPAHPASRPGPSLSCLWELSHAGREQSLPQGVAEQVAAANIIGINVLAYATNRELKYKDEIPSTVKRGGPQTNLARARLTIGKLRHGGGWNVAPAALPNLQRMLNQEVGLRVSTDLPELAIGDEKIFNYHLLFMHGRHEFTLSDQERKQLRTYIERGGMILADSVCASAAFDRAFRREMAAIFPDQALERIPVGHPLFSPEYGGFDLTSVTRRDPQRGQGRAEATLRKVEPELEGIKQGEHYAVIYSPYDLSCALENHESLECQGYTRDDAARIGINVVLYSLHE
jgi:hypothetical protein